MTEIVIIITCAVVVAFVDYNFFKGKRIVKDKVKKYCK
jgi:hypothetical protein